MTVLAIPRAADLPGDTQLLVTLVRDCVTAGIGRHVLLVRLSAMPAARRRPHHLRLARAAIEPLARADRARIFALPGDDLAVAWRGEAALPLTAATAAVARLFEGEALPPAARPWELFALPGQAEQLMASICPPPPPAHGEDGPSNALDIAALGALEAGLAGADVARFARRCRVCEAVVGTFRLRWEQRFLSIAELTDTLAPGRAVQADPWLYRRLSRTLDQRMLALLAAPHELRDAGPFSVALTVAAILSPGFLRFDAALPAILRGQVVLELRPADVLGDLAAFVFARDFALARSYRLVLADLDPELLAMFPLGRIGVDFLQMPWSEALRGRAGELVLEDPARTVLTQVDTPQALAWGHAHGIGYFQGRMAEPS